MKKFKKIDVKRLNSFLKYTLEDGVSYRLNTGLHIDRSEERFLGECMLSPQRICMEIVHYYSEYMAYFLIEIIKIPSFYYYCVAPKDNLIHDGSTEGQTSFTLT